MALVTSFPGLLALTSCAGLTDAETHSNAGVALHEAGRYERAIAEYDEAIRSDPALALAYHNRRVAYATLGEFERAIEDYDESIRLDPQRAEAFRGRAFAHHALGHQERADGDDQEATRLSRLPGVVSDDSSIANDLRTALDFLSSYGPRVLAAIGTGLIGATVLVGSIRLRRWMDRPLLRPNAMLDYLHDLQGPPDGVLKLFFEARNPHSSPVTVQSLGLELGSGPDALLAVPPEAGHVFPHEVKKGESITEWTDVPRLLGLLSERGQTPSDLKWVWFRTSSGERHRARIGKKVVEGLSNFTASAPAHAGLTSN